MCLEVNDDRIERETEFQYLDSVVPEKGDIDEDVPLICPIWRSHHLRRHTNLSIFESNVTCVFCMDVKLRKCPI